MAARVAEVVRSVRPRARMPNLAALPAEPRDLLAPELSVGEPRELVVSRTGHATYEQIVRNSLEVTEARMVVFTVYDPVTQLAQTDAWAAQPRATVQRALDTVRRVFPGWDPGYIEHLAMVNPLLEQVYIDGESVAGSIGDLLAGVVDPMVTQVGSTFLAMRAGLICPLKTGEEVLGSLTFFFSDPVSDRQQQICEGFAHEAALTLENGRLAVEFQKQVQRLQEVRIRAREAEERQREEIAELLHSRVQSNLLLLWRKVGSARELIDGDPDRAKAELTDAQAELDRIREQEIRQASYLLHPSIIRVGLVPALRSLSAQLERWIDVSLAVDPAINALDNPMDNELPDEFRLAVFRIVEASLNRVRRLAEGTRVEVGLRAGAHREFILTLSHQGQAFMLAPDEDEFALTTISDRIEPLGGTWTVERLPDGCTRLSVSLTLNRPTSP